MEIIGRVTKDATVTTLKDNRAVVHFSIAMNDYYKPKGASETKQITTYVDCSYWLSSKVAALLTKGALVELSGRIGVQAYKVQEDAKAKLTFHVNSFKLHGRSGANHSPVTAQVSQPVVSEPLDDIPF